MNGRCFWNTWWKKRGAKQSLLVFLGCWATHWLLAASLSAQVEGLVSRIENPSQYFSDERRTWIGRTIRFLECPTHYQRNPYFDWYYDPFNPAETKPDPKALKFREAVFEEVWVGRLFIQKQQESYWRMGFFWRAKLIDTGESIYFWDDGEGGHFNFGFVDDYLEARKHIGEKFWNQSLHVLYKPDNSGTLALRNLEELTLTDVRWGEYGNFPLKFFLRKKDGSEGYLIFNKFLEFAKKIHRSDPRQNFPTWNASDWDDIERRTLRTGMTPQMVQLAWGQPAKIDLKHNPAGKSIEIWTYEGVRETTYFLQFENGKLKAVTWEEGKEKR